MVRGQYRKTVAFVDLLPDPLTLVFGLHDDSGEKTLLGHCPFCKKAVDLLLGNRNLRSDFPFKKDRDDMLLLFGPVRFEQFGIFVQSLVVGFPRSRTCRSIRVCR